MTAEQKGQPREDGQSSKYEGEAWVKIVSASVGSAITALAVTPLDVVKVRQQAAGLSPGNAAAPVSAAPAPKTPAGTTSRSPSRSGASCARGCGTFVLNTGLGEYLTSRNRAGYFDPKTGALKQEKSVAEVLKTGGPFRIIRSIFAHEGLAGIYAGLAPTLVMGIPNTVLYFYTYEELALRFKERFPTNSPVSGAVPAISGASARFVASLSTAPLELLRTRQAARAGLDVSGTVSGREGRGMISEFRTMIKQDGVLSLFRGVRPTLMRDVPFSAIYWVCVENMRNFWRTRHRDLSTSAVSTTEQTIEALINGSVSGVIAAAFTTPLDVLKTRSQIETPAAVSVGKAAAVENVCVAPRLFCHHGGALAVHPESARLVSPAGSTAGTGTTQRLSTMNIAKSIVQAEGMGGLWRGNVARCMKVAPACGIMIATYEAGKRILTVD